ATCQPLPQPPLDTEMRFAAGALPPQAARSSPAVTVKVAAIGAVRRTGVRISTPVSSAIARKRTFTFCLPTVRLSPPPAPAPAKRSVACEGRTCRDVPGTRDPGAWGPDNVRIYRFVQDQPCPGRQSLHEAEFLHVVRLWFAVWGGCPMA